MAVPGNELVATAAKAVGADRPMSPLVVLHGISRELKGREHPDDVSAVLAQTGMYLRQLVRGELDQAGITALTA